MDQHPSPLTTLCHFLHSAAAPGCVGDGAAGAELADVAGGEVEVVNPGSLVGDTKIHCQTDHFYFTSSHDMTKGNNDLPVPVGSAKPTQ